VNALVSLATVVALSGCVDAPVCGELENVLLAEARKGPCLLAVDLSGMDVMDLMALAVIVWASRVLNFYGGTLMLVSPQPAIAGLLERSGMAPMLPVLGSAVQASGVVEG
jgi:anti-anti-sigma factor